MQEVSNFSLERHAGEYETWPLRSRLIRDGVSLGITLPGYDLLRQYEAIDSYLFVTDHDCPFEESTCFILVDKALKRILSERSLGAWYSSYWLKELFWEDERHFTAMISQLPFRFTIRKWYIPWLRPKLSLSWPAPEKE